MEKVMNSNVGLQQSCILSRNYLKPVTLVNH